MWLGSGHSNSETSDLGGNLVRVLIALLQNWFFRQDLWVQQEDQGLPSVRGQGDNSKDMIPASQTDFPWESPENKLRRPVAAPTAFAPKSQRAWM